MRRNQPYSLSTGSRSTVAFGIDARNPLAWAGFAKR
jgi:hypothetical protein